MPDSAGQRVRCGSSSIVQSALLVLSVVISVPASAQNLTTPEFGTRVRVVFAPDSLNARLHETSGLFVLRTNSGIVLDRGSQGLDTIQASLIRRIDRQTGTRSAGTNFLRSTMFGTLIGGGLGLLGGAAAHDSYSCSDGGFCISAGGGALAGGVVGAVLGAIIGLIYGPTEQWQRGEMLR